MGACARLAIFKLAEQAEADSMSRFRRAAAGSAIALFLVPSARAQIITTIAGGGPAANTPGTSVGVAPGGIAVDSHDNVYITSFTSVYRLSGGLVTPIAGDGGEGYQGDGGPATSAQVEFPQGIALDSSGNVYFNDANNYRIRAINMQATTQTLLGVSIGPGQIATVAGNGNYGGGHGSSGNGGPATQAAIEPAHGIAVDAAGNLYFSDQFDQVVREVSTTGTLSTLLGNGASGNSCSNGPAATASLDGPTNVAFDAAGNLYVVERGRNCVEVYNRQPTAITVFGVTVQPGYLVNVAGGSYGYSGDNGPATSAAMRGPTAITFDSKGNLYICDRDNYVVRMVTPSGTISTFAGNGNRGFSGDNGPATSASLANPWSLGADSEGNIFIGDSFEVREVSGGTIQTVVGNGTCSGTYNGAATSAQLCYPDGIFISGGTVYIADTQNNTVRALNGGTISLIAGTGGYGYGGDGGAGTSALLAEPAGIAVDGAGNLYICDLDNDVVRKLTSAGTISTVVGPGQPLNDGDNGPATAAWLGAAWGVALDAAGNLYIADSDNYRVRVVNNQSGSITVYGVTVGPGDIATVAGSLLSGNSGDGGPATSAQMQYPTSVAFDAAGNLYIADAYSDVVRKVDGSGTISTVAGSGLGRVLFSGDGGPATNADLYDPFGIAVDRAGNVYIADTANERIRAVNMQSNPITLYGVSIAPGNIATIVGNGTAGFGGDGGSPIYATLNSPYGLALDAAGNLYFDDSFNSRVREVMPPATIQVTVGTNPAGLSFTLDGTDYTTAQTRTWSTNDSHAIATISTESGSPGTQYDFSGWSDNGAISHTVSTFFGTTYTANFSTEYQLTTAANPTAAGSVTPGAADYYDSTSSVPLTASANAGWAFTGWTGPVAAPASASTSVTLAAPESVTANFSPNGAPAVWIVDGTGGLSARSDTGVAVNSTAYTGGKTAIALDATGNEWTLDTASSLVYETNQLGAAETTIAAGVGGLNAPEGFAVDGNSQLWIANSGNNSLSVFTNTGTAVSPSGGFTGSSLATPAGLAVDLAGSVWVANKTGNSVTRFLGAAAPAAPLATAAADNTTGEKP